MKRRLTASVVFVLRDDGSALLQHRDDKPGLRRAGMWVPPGGHCEGCESIADCARRELLEETGYAAGRLHWLATVEDDPGDGNAVITLHVFWTRYDGGQPVDCREGLALVFVPRPLADAYPIPEFLRELWDQAIAEACSECDALVTD
jgi:ADP-ribose pyrophosphatase YjhB (NUDIX family)